MHKANASCVSSALLNTSVNIKGAKEGEGDHWGISCLGRATCGLGSGAKNKHAWRSPQTHMIQIKHVNFSPGLTAPGSSAKHQNLDSLHSQCSAVIQNGKRHCVLDSTAGPKTHMTKIKHVAFKEASVTADNTTQQGKQENESHSTSLGCLKSA